MEIIKTYKYRLRLNKLQQQRIDAWINTCRAIYNLALETKIYAYRSNKKNLSAFDLMKQLTDLRHEFDWVTDVPINIEEDAIERMDKAYKSFFRGGGFPKFQKKLNYNSITLKHGVKKVCDGGFKLCKIGTVRIYKDRPIQGELRRATITRKNNKYYICILTKQEREIIPNANNNQVGIDMGLAFFASLSDGTQIENPRHTLKYAKRLRIAQRSLARKVKESNHWSKQKLLIGKLQEKIANVRADFLHKNSITIVSKFNFIAVENLNVKGMVRNGNLAKHISDASWSEFFRQLEYKSQWNGCEFVKIDPKYTSQTCNECGYTNKMSRVSQSKFVCTHCGIEANADVNAAKNILGRGMAFIRQREAVACA